MTDSIPLGFGEFFCCIGVSGDIESLSVGDIESLSVGDIESLSVGDRGEPGLNGNSQGVGIGLTEPAIIK